MARYKAKRTFSDGRDSEGKLIVFEKGKSYNMSEYSPDKLRKIRRFFEKTTEKEVKEIEKKTVDVAGKKVETASVDNKAQKRGGKK